MKEKQTSAQKLANKYLIQSKEDIKIAKQIFKKKDFTKCSLLTVQSAINALTAICVACNQFQNPTYSLSELLIFCKKLDESFLELEKDCQVLDGIQEFTFFSDQRESSQIPIGKAKLYLEKAIKISDFTVQKIKQHKLFVLPFWI